MSDRCDPIDAAGHGLEFLIGHVMAPDAGIVPVGDVDRAIGTDTDIGGSEPGILGGDEIQDAGGIAGA